MDLTNRWSLHDGGSGCGPVGTAPDFASAQTPIRGGDACALVANGPDGCLFTDGSSGTAGAVDHTDIARGALA